MIIHTGLKTICITSLPHIRISLARTSPTFPHFRPMLSFYTHCKHEFSGVFRGYKKETSVRNVLIGVNKVLYPAGIYLLKVNNRNARTMW